MKSMRNMALVVIFAGLACLAIGVIGKFVSFPIAGFSPRGLGQGASICFLLSINLLLLDKKS